MWLRSCFSLFHVFFGMIMYGAKFRDIRIEYLLEQAKYAGGKGFAEQAIEYLKKASELDSGNFRVNAGLALAYSQKGDFDSALDYANKATSKADGVEGPVREGLDSLLAVILEMLGKTAAYAKAIDDMVRRYNGNAGLVHDQVARMYFELGIYENAEHHCREVIKLDPGKPEPYRKLAWTLFEENKFEIAEQNLSKAIEIANDRNRKAELNRELDKMRKVIARKKGHRERVAVK